MSTPTALVLRLRRPHRAWTVAAVAFVALLGAAGFRATPGVLIVPLQEEFGCSRTTISLAVSVNLVLFGLTAPFAAALMERFGLRRVVTSALLLVATGSGLTVFRELAAGAALGVLVGVGTGSVALVFAATVATRWFQTSRGLVTGVRVPPCRPRSRMCRQIYGPKHAAVIFGWVFASHQVGAAVAATAAGAARTQFGDYTLAWMVAGGLSLLAAVLSLRIARPVRAVTDAIRPAAAAV